MAGKYVKVDVQVNEKMRQALLKSLRAACVEPMEHVIKILSTRDTDRNKLRAIELYCKKTLEVIKATADKELK